MAKLNVGKKSYEVPGVVMLLGFVAILAFLFFMVKAIFLGLFGISNLMFGTIWPAIIVIMLSFRLQVNSTYYGLLPRRIADTKAMKYVTLVITLIAIAFYITH